MTEEPIRPRSGVNISLCSGAGTLDLAVEQITGNRTTVYAENDPFASRVMAAHFPDAVNLGDITKADWVGVAGKYTIQSLSAGFPCTDISDAGKKSGIHGKHSGIWKNVAQAVGVIRPRLVFLENVAAIRSRGLNVVVEDLASIGYGIWWTCLRASEVGAPHRRWRWFAVARPVAEDPDIESWRERWSAAPGQAQGRRTRTDAGRRSGVPVPSLMGTPLTTSAAGPGRLDHPNNWTRLATQVHLISEGGEPCWVTSTGVDYGPAIRRWEETTGVSAPYPTERGIRGNRRLSAFFVEWMQGCEPGYVTEVPGLNRPQQIKILGNVAMTQQAVEGYRRLLCADLEAMNV